MLQRVVLVLVVQSRSRGDSLWVGWVVLVTVNCVSGQDFLADEVYCAILAGYENSVTSVLRHRRHRPLLRAVVWVVLWGVPVCSRRAWCHWNQTAPCGFSMTSIHRMSGSHLRVSVAILRLPKMPLPLTFLSSLHLRPLSPRRPPFNRTTWTHCRLHLVMTMRFSSHLQKTLLLAMTSMTF